MILAALILLAISTVGVASLVGQQARAAYRAHRAARANLERQKRWAERRLHDVSSKAFESMFEAARQASEVDQPWRSDQ
ncbi:MAG: hypothetical protein ACLPYW_13660 [Acidimicrobiales bacterium]